MAVPISFVIPQIMATAGGLGRWLSALLFDNFFWRV